MFKNNASCLKYYIMYFFFDWDKAIIKVHYFEKLATLSQRTYSAAYTFNMLKNIKLKYLVMPALFTKFWLGKNKLFFFNYLSVNFVYLNSSFKYETHIAYVEGESMNNFYDKYSIFYNLFIEHYRSTFKFCTYVDCYDSARTYCTFNIKYITNNYLFSDIQFNSLTSIKPLIYMSINSNLNIFFYNKIYFSHFLAAL
jgi:hypothetical protein